MINLRFSKRFLIDIFILIFSLVFFLVYEGVAEKVFFVLFIYGCIRVYKGRSSIKEPKDIALVFMFAFIVYILSTIVLFTQSYRMHLPDPSPHVKREETAVLLVYEGESERYSVSKELQNLRKDRSLNNIVFAPFKLNQTKRDYNHIGRSIYRENTIVVQENLQNTLGNDYKVYIGYLKDSNYVEEVLIDIVNDGYHKVIIVPVFLTDGSSYDNLRKRVLEMRLINFKVSIKFTEALWNNEVVVQSYVNNITNFAKAERAVNTGVVLIGEGERKYKKGQYISGVKEDTTFRIRLKSSLVNQIGLQESKIRLAWYNDLEPSYIGELRSILERGASEIFCVLIKAAPTDIENNRITREIKKRLDIPKVVEVKVIDGFLKDNSIIQELKNRVEFTNMQSWK